MADVFLTGVTFGNRQKIIRKYCHTNIPVIFRREPENTYDPNAIAVYVQAGDHLESIGYFPREDAECYSKTLANGKGIEGCVVKVIGGVPGKPSLGVILAVYIISKKEMKTRTSQSIPDPVIPAITKNDTFFDKIKKIFSKSS